MERLEEIQDRLNKATPGPWMWDIRTKIHSCMLLTTHSGKYYVMGFERWGMQDACPTFQVYNKYDGPVTERGSQGMLRADKLSMPTDGKQYRIGYDEYIHHPDADLIANAPTDIKYLLETVATLQQENAELKKALELAEWELRHATNQCPVMLHDKLAHCKNCKTIRDNSNMFWCDMATSRWLDYFIHQAKEELGK